MHTPATLIKTALTVTAMQALVALVIAVAVPGGASWLTLMGYVTPGYADNPLAIRLLTVPATDPPVYITVQNLAQILAVALACAAVVGIVKANPWRSGELAASTVSASGAAHVSTDTGPGTFPGAEGQMPGQVPGQMPGQLPPGQMPPGQMPPGQMPPGQMPPGQFPGA